MEYKIDFKCVLHNADEIPEEVINSEGVNFPNVHIDGESMANVSKAIKEYSSDVLCMVPFCLTVEAEALGADIKLGDAKVGPRVSNYAFKDIEELKQIKSINLNKGRISEVLKAVEMLNKQNEIVALTVQGPFTIMSSLIDPRLFYKAVRKDKETVEFFMNSVVDSIVKFIEEGIKRGAKIISFGDSAGTLDILGPKMYKEFSGRYSYEVLKRVYENLGHSIIHLCGITSNSMHKSDFIKSEPIEFPKDITYGEVIKDIIKNRTDIKIIGHNCLKKTKYKLRNSIVWKINL